MKTLKLIPLLAVCAAVSMLTSCLTDDEGTVQNSLTPSDIALCIQQMKGSYDGRLFFYDSSNNVDSIDGVHWLIDNDTTLVIKNLSPAALVSRVSDKELKAALEKAEPQPIVCKYAVVNNNPIQWLVNPVGPAYDVEYSDGSKHEVVPVFIHNHTSSYGTVDSKHAYLQLLLYGFYVDQKLATDFYNYTGEAIPMAILSYK